MGSTAPSGIMGSTEPRGIMGSTGPRVFNGKVEAITWKVLRSPSLITGLILNTGNTTGGVTSGAGTDYPSAAHTFTPVFIGVQVAQSVV
jgi:hypothetical protein